MYNKSFDFEELFVAHKHIERTSLSQEQKDEFKQHLLSTYNDSSVHEDIEYVVDNSGAEKDQSLFDYDYIFAMAKSFNQYLPEVLGLVNKNSSTFKFDEMDIIDRTIFLLWYAEFKNFATPKAIVLNEMIEYAKRFGDDSSYKLVHGIGHNLLV